MMFKSNLGSIENNCGHVLVCLVLHGWLVPLYHVHGKPNANLDPNVSRVPSKLNQRRFWLKRATVKKVSRIRYFFLSASCLAEQSDSGEYLQHQDFFLSASIFEPFFWFSFTSEVSFRASVCSQSSLTRVTIEVLIQWLMSRVLVFLGW